MFTAVMICNVSFSHKAKWAQVHKDLFFWYLHRGNPGAFRFYRIIKFVQFDKSIIQKSNFVVYTPVRLGFRSLNVFYTMSVDNWWRRHWQARWFTSYRWFSLSESDHGFAPDLVLYFTELYIVNGFATCRVLAVFNSSPRGLWRKPSVWFKRREVCAFTTR